jgi:cation transport regulator ChaC
MTSDIQTLLAPDGDFYVFAYGSLIWRPGFDHAARHPALLRGFHRRFCLWSHRYRGTPERPGLVLGLDRGGACRGAVFRVPGRAAAETLAYLDARELPDGAEVVYRRRLLPLLMSRTATAGFIAATSRQRFWPGRLARAMGRWDPTGIICSIRWIIWKKWVCGTAGLKPSRRWWAVHDGYGVICRNGSCFGWIGEGQDHGLATHGA